MVPERRQGMLSKYILPAFSGIVLAGLVVLCVAAVTDYVANAPGSHPESDVLSTPGYGANPEILVHAAASHMGKAAKEAEAVERLRKESHAASIKATMLERELRRVEAKEAARDKEAVLEAEKAKVAEKQAYAREAEQRSAVGLREGLFNEARAKRAAFLRDERMAGESKAEAHTLLNQERELFAKSFKLFDKELDIERRVKSERNKVRELSSLGKATTQELSDIDDRALYPAKAKPAHAMPHKAAVAASKPIKEQHRPLWGARKWPSYYQNALDDKKVFSVDAPQLADKQADAKLDKGDDDKSIDSAARTPQRCSMGKPCLDMSRVPHAPRLSRNQQAVMMPHEYPAGSREPRYDAQYEESRPQARSEGERGPVREDQGGETRGRMQAMWQEELPAHPSLEGLEAMSPEQRSWLFKKLGIQEPAAQQGGGATAAVLHQFESHIVKLEQPLVQMEQRLEQEYRQDAVDTQNRKARLNREEHHESALSIANREEQKQHMEDNLEKEKQALVESMENEMKQVTANLQTQEHQQAEALEKQESALRERMRNEREGSVRQAAQAVSAEDREKEAKLKQALDAAVRAENAKVLEMQQDMDKVVESAKLSEEKVEHEALEASKAAAAKAQAYKLAEQKAKLGAAAVARAAAAAVQREKAQALAQEGGDITHAVHSVERAESAAVHRLEVKEKQQDSKMQNLKEALAVEKEKELMMVKQRKAESALRKRMNERMQAKLNMVEKQEKDEERKLKEQRAEDNKLRQEDIEKATQLAVQRLARKDAEKRNEDQRKILAEKAKEAKLQGELDEQRKMRMDEDKKIRQVEAKIVTEVKREKREENPIRIAQANSAVMHADKAVEAKQKPIAAKKEESALQLAIEEHAAQVKAQQKRQAAKKPLVVRAKETALAEESEGDAAESAMEIARKDEKAEKRKLMLAEEAKARVDEKLRRYKAKSATPKARVDEKLRCHKAKVQTQVNSRLEQYEHKIDQDMTRKLQAQRKANERLVEELQDSTGADTTTPQAVQHQEHQIVAAAPVDQAPEVAAEAEGGQEEAIKDTKLESIAKALGFPSANAYLRHLGQAPEAPSSNGGGAEMIPSSDASEYINAVAAEKNAANVRKTAQKAFYNSGLVADQNVPAAKTASLSSWFSSWL